MPELDDLDHLLRELVDRQARLETRVAELELLESLVLPQGLDTTDSPTFANIFSDTYTPTFTLTTNIASASAAADFQYLRVGNVVTVSGRVDIDPTAAAPTASVLGISLPIASNIALNGNLGGTAINGLAGTQVAAIDGDAVNNRAQMRWQATDTAIRTWSFSFTYLVL